MSHADTMSNTIEAITPTVCQLMNVAPPNLAKAAPVDKFIDAAKAELVNGTVEKCLIYCPDAMGMHVYRAYPQVIERARSLLNNDRHDVIIVYCQEYDDTMHRTAPFSEEAV